MAAPTTTTSTTTATTTVTAATGDNGEEEDWLATWPPAVRSKETVSIREQQLQERRRLSWLGRTYGCCYDASFGAANSRRRQPNVEQQPQQQDQVQVEICRQLSGCSVRLRRQQMDQEEFCWPLCASVIDSDVVVGANEDATRLGSVKSHKRLEQLQPLLLRARGTKGQRCRSGSVARTDEHEIEARELQVVARGGARNREQRKSIGKSKARVHLGELKSAHRISCSFSMWPSWHRLVLVCFLSLALTSLLASLNIMFNSQVSPASSSTTCLLFNHCHALSVSSSSSGQSISSSGGGKSMGVNAAPSVQAATVSPRALKLNKQTPSATNRLVASSSSLQQPQTTAPITASLSVPATTELYAADYNNNLIATAPTTTTAATTTTTTTLTTTSTAGSTTTKATVDKPSGATSAAAVARVLPTAQSAGANTINVGSSPSQQQLQKLRPLSRIKHWYQQQQQAKLIQLGSNSNETIADSFGHFKQNNNDNDDNQPSSGSNNNGQQQHFQFSNNYQANDADESDNNGSRRATLAGVQTSSSEPVEPEERPSASSITRAESVTVTGRMGEPLAASAAEHRQRQQQRPGLTLMMSGQQYAGRQLADVATTTASQILTAAAPPVPNQLSLTSAIRLIASPSLALPSEMRSDNGHRLQSRPLPKLMPMALPLHQRRRLFNSTTLRNTDRPLLPLPPASLVAVGGWPLTTNGRVGAEVVNTTTTTSTTEAPIIIATGANETIKTATSAHSASIAATTVMPTAATNEQQQQQLRASGRSSTPGANLPSSAPTATATAASRRQFLVPAGLEMPHSLIQNAVREALNDFMVSTGEQIFSAASAARPLVLRPHSLISALAGAGSLGGNAGAEFDQKNNQLASGAAPFSPSGLNFQEATDLLKSSSAFQSQRFPFSQQQGAIGDQKRQQQSSSKSMSIASASAPSISLSPLSRLLSPRNPFRLFASSSTPTATQYRPSFLHPNRPASSANRWLMGASRNKSQQKQLTQKQQQQQQHQVANLAALEAAGSIEHQLPVPTILPATVFQGSAQTLAGDEQLGSLSSTPNLYAHSHSAEQLEQLVRAASQSSGIHSPILPAIVSAPAGAIPGFYIPAIESESESQVNVMRHGKSDAASMISSKVPGTDYILHPDEVRAMINIGELAWRQQQRQRANAVAASTKSSSSSSGDRGQQAASSHQMASASQQQQERAESERSTNWNAPIGHYQIGWAPENHAENMRDYSYVDPQMRKENMQAAYSSINQQQQTTNQYQWQRQQQNNSTGELVSQIANHFRQNQLEAFPAIIRVNDQDYVHWPLIKIGTEDQLVAASGGYRKQFDNNGMAPPGERIFAFASSPHQPQPVSFNGGQNWPAREQQERLLKQEGTPSVSTAAARGFQQSAMQMAAIGNSNHHQDKGNLASDLEHSPLRLATQLTPSEIRQVEDSIIEALIMAQTIQHQRKIAEHLAANQNIPVFIKPNVPHSSDLFRWPSNSGNTGQQQHKRANQRFRNGFFGRRRRRNSSQASASRVKSQQREQQHSLATAESSPQFFPLLNMSVAPVSILGPLMRFDSVAEDSIRLEALKSEGPVNHRDSSTAPTADAAEIIVEHPKRQLPVVMADQETNKPLLANSATSASSLGRDPISDSTPLLAESTETRVSILSPSAQSLIATGRRAVRLNDNGARSIVSSVPPLQPAFGSRVSAPRTTIDHERTMTAATRGTNELPGSSSNSDSNQSSREHHSQVSPQASMRGQKASIAMATANSTEIRQQQDFYDDDNDQDDQTTIRSGASDNSRRPVVRQHRERINVDWPGMVSDADYFPRGQQHIEDRRPTRSQSTESRQTTAGPQLSSAESRNIGDNLSPRDEAWPGRRFVTSQLKLQFAEDYQAREGVPIYNNNVRVAGGLERQRSLATQSGRQISPPPMSEFQMRHLGLPLSSLLSASSSLSEINDVESGNDDESEEMNEFDDKTGDLLQRGTSDDKRSAQKPKQTQRPDEQVQARTERAAVPKLVGRQEKTDEGRPNLRGPQFVTSQAKIIVPTTS